MKLVYIFTLNGCSHCSLLKKSLTEEGIPFHDVEITQNRELWRSIVEQTKEDILPTVFIQTSDTGNGTVYIPGRDFQNDKEIIEIIKNNI